jgi:hypothetical protein
VGWNEGSHCKLRLSLTPSYCCLLQTYTSFKQEDGTSDSTGLDTLQQNETEGWDEVVTHLHPPCTFPDHSDVDKALPICEQPMEEDIRSTQMDT